MTDPVPQNFRGEGFCSLASSTSGKTEAQRRRRACGPFCRCYYELVSAQTTTFLCRSSCYNNEVPSYPPKSHAPQHLRPPPCIHGFARFLTNYCGRVQHRRVLTLVSQAWKPGGSVHRWLWWPGGLPACSQPHVPHLWSEGTSVPHLLGVLWRPSETMRSQPLFGSQECKELYVVDDQHKRCASAVHRVPLKLTELTLSIQTWLRIPVCMVFNNFHVAEFWRLWY